MGAACRARARRAGRAGAVRWRKRHTGRHPRGSSSGPVPSCLTSSRVYAMMLTEGSRRQRPQRCLAHDATKARPSHDVRALLYPVTPRTRPLAASYAPNASKPSYFVAFTGPKTKPPLHRYVTATKNRLLLRFAPVGSSRLYSIWDACTSLRCDTPSLSQRRRTCQLTIMRTRVRMNATRLFFCFCRVFCFQLRRSHGVDHRHRRAAVVHRLAHALDIAVPAQQLHRIHLTEAVRGHVLRQAERLGSSFHVLPNRLPRAVLPVVPTGKHPVSPTGFRTHLRNQPVRQIHTPPLPGLLLHNPELPPDLPRAQRQNVADP